MSQPRECFTPRASYPCHVCANTFLPGVTYTIPREYDPTKPSCGKVVVNPTVAACAAGYDFSAQKVVECGMCKGTGWVDNRRLSRGPRRKVADRRSGIVSESTFLAAGNDTPRTNAIIVEGHTQDDVYRLLSHARQLERELSEDCEDCDHGIRGGAPCQSCGGCGRVLIADLLKATQRHVKELKGMPSAELGTFNEWFVKDYRPDPDLPMKEKMRLAWNAARGSPSATASTPSETGPIMPERCPESVRMALHCKYGCAPICEYCDGMTRAHYDRIRATLAAADSCLPKP